MIPLEIAFLYFLTIYIGVYSIIKYNNKKRRLERLKKQNLENYYKPKL